MAKCKTCRGKGRWQEVDLESFDHSSMWYECNDCRGTGQLQDEEDGGDFDLAGVGVTEGDDDDQT